MTLKTEEKLIELCNAFASGLSYNNAAQYCGVSPSSLFSWMRQSNAGDERFLITYCDQPMQFAEAMALARKMVHMEARARFERRSMLGHDEVVTFQGAVCWQVDRRTVGWSEDDREAFGFRRDGLLENEKGEVIPLTVHHEPPVAAQLRLLEMSFPEEFTPSSNVNIANTDTGVLQKPPVTEKIAVPAKPVRPELPKPEPAEQVEVLPDTVEDLLGPEPEPNVVVEPGPMIKTETPTDLQPAPNPLIAPRGSRPLSDLERDLLSKLPSSLSR